MSPWQAIPYPYRSGAVRLLKIALAGALISAGSVLLQLVSLEQGWLMFQATVGAALLAAGEKMARELNRVSKARQGETSTEILDEGEAAEPEPEKPKPKRVRRTLPKP